MKTKTHTEAGMGSIELTLRERWLMGWTSDMDIAPWWWGGRRMNDGPKLTRTQA